MVGPCIGCQMECLYTGGRLLVRSFAKLVCAAESVRKRLYVPFPDGMSEAKIREKMRGSLREWRPEAARTDAMDVVDPSPAATVSCGKGKAGHGLTANV